MSSILGVIAKNKSAPLPIANLAKTEKPIHIFSNNRIAFRIFGIHDTCVFSKTADDAGFVILGLGIDFSNGISRAISQNQWRSILERQTPNLKSISGHFLIVRWTKQQVDIFNDQFGLRPCFIRESESEYFFSSRLDWLNQCFSNSELNPKGFATHWLGFNALSAQTKLTQNIKRLGQLGHAQFTNDSVKITSQKWENSFVARDPNSIINDISTILNLEIEKPISLGFSGGMDSRVLFGLLKSNKKQKYQTHIFGPKTHPDIAISKLISKKFGVSHIHIADHIPAPEMIIKMLREYVAATNAIAPATMAIRLQPFTELGKKGMFMFDGGFGEIGRRQFFHRLKLHLHGKEPKNFASSFENVMIHRTDIFNDEFVTGLKANAIHEFESEWQSMPFDYSENPDNFLDLFAIRTRLPNYYSFEQARLDSLLPNLMPFAQPEIVNALLSLPTKLRANSQLFRRLISESDKTLTRFPLVKGDQTYPFGFGTWPARIWTGVKSHFLKSKTISQKVLENIRPFIQDHLASKSVLEFQFYDQAKIKSLSDRIQANDASVWQELDWWLAFDLWRESNGIS